MLNTFCKFIHYWDSIDCSCFKGVKFVPNFVSLFWPLLDFILELVHIYLENPWLENNLIWTNSSGVLYYLVVYLLTDFWLRSLNLLFIFQVFQSIICSYTYFRSTKWDKFVYEYLYNVLLFGEAVSIYVSMYVLHAYITLIVSFYLSFLCYFSYFSSLNCEICTYFNEKKGKRFLGT